MRATLEKLPGVKGAEITAGNAEITVHYDAAKIKPADMVAKLVAAGESGAKVKS